ncbi:hypothetical protein Lal_00043087 [Lupinus albus]|nr:hypothetical protein Lal_00043087 [Lupinus albus]
MRQMWNVRVSQSPLPYAIFITKILEHFSVSLDGETKVALNLRESKIDVEVVHKMGFTMDPIDHQSYRHRTDQPTAPTIQLEPTIPNPSKFQAQSSSSAAMPSNQMIMDELVSLRGYITTRMDALDTQNQQIHYEHHRLSLCLDSWLFFFWMKSKGGEKLGEVHFLHVTPSMLLSENYTFKKILICHHQKGGDCDEDLATDIDTVLMKTPTSLTRRKEE